MKEWITGGPVRHAGAGSRAVGSAPSKSRLLDALRLRYAECRAAKPNTGIVEWLLKEDREIGGRLLWLSYHRRSVEAWEILEGLGMDGGRVMVASTIAPPGVPGVSQTDSNYLVAEFLVCHIVTERGYQAQLEGTWPDALEEMLPLWKEEDALIRGLLGKWEGWEPDDPRYVAPIRASLSLRYKSFSEAVEELRDKCSDYNTEPGGLEDTLLWQIFLLAPGVLGNTLSGSGALDGLEGWAKRAANMVSNALREGSRPSKESVADNVSMEEPVGEDIVLADTLQDEGHDPLSILLRREAANDVQAAVLKHLTGAPRAYAKLVLEEGYDPKKDREELAETIGVKPNTVSKTIGRVREALQNTPELDGIVDKKEHASLPYGPDDVLRPGERSPYDSKAVRRHMFDAKGRPYPLYSFCYAPVQTEHHIQKDWHLDPKPEPKPIRREAGVGMQHVSRLDNPQLVRRTVEDWEKLGAFPFPRPFIYSVDDAATLVDFEEAVRKQELLLEHAAPRRADNHWNDEASDYWTERTGEGDAA